jgi:hypothetical protein
VVISWIAHHGRSVVLADALGGRAEFMPWAHARGSKRTTLLGWFRSAGRTWRLVRDLAPGSVVVTMVPPVFAPLTALAAARRVRVVIDAHSGAFNDPTWRWSHGLVRWAARRCGALIVTNTALVEGMDLRGVRVLVAHNPIAPPPPPLPSPPPGNGRPYVVFPCSGALDEPLGAVSAAARELAGEVEIRVTGRVDAARVAPAIDTGFLSAADYDRVLRGASAVLALTTREATMQQSAYEALGLGLPIVASSTQALRGALDGAAVYVDDDGPSLAAGIRQAVAEGPALRQAVARTARELSAVTEAALDQVRALLREER